MVDFLHLCENAAASEQANNLLVPPCEDLGRLQGVRAFSSIVHSLRRGRKRAFPSLGTGNTHCLRGYKSINGIKPSISRAVRGILKEQYALPYRIFFGQYFPLPHTHSMVQPGVVT